MMPVETDPKIIEEVRRLARIETTLDQVNAEIMQLRTALTQVLNEVRTQTTKISEQVKEMELDCVRRGEQSLQMSRSIAQHEERIKTIEQMLPVIKILIWIGTALGGSIIALIWAFITGRANVAFK